MNKFERPEGESAPEVDAREAEIQKVLGWIRGGGDIRRGDTSREVYMEAQRRYDAEHPREIKDPGAGKEPFEAGVERALHALRQGAPLTRRDWSREVAEEAIRRHDAEQAKSKEKPE